MAERVLIVGDSQAAGPVGFHLERDLQQAGAQVRRIAHSGHGAADWVRLHWQEYLTALRTVRPTDVILLFGSNDPAEATLEDAFQQFKASTSANVWYAGPPQYPTLPERQQRSAEIRALAKHVFGSKHLDAWPYTGLNVPRAADGVHFNADGGAVWARGIFTAYRSRSALVVAAFAAALGIAAGWWLWQRR